MSKEVPLGAVGPAWYRKKPVVIEALKLGDSAEGLKALKEFCPECRVENGVSATRFSVQTLEGTMEAGPGDWLLRGVKGEFYFCRSDIFNDTYEAAEPDS